MTTSPFVPNVLAEMEVEILISENSTPQKRFASYFLSLAYFISK